MNRSELDPDASPESKFGAFLRSSRDARKWTQEELGARVGYSGTHVSAVENGRRPPTPRFARQLDRVLGTEDLFQRQARELHSSALLEGFAEYAAHEARAVELRLFDLGIVPGLLQTQGYAAAIAAAAVRRGSITQDQADERVAVLARRQAKLNREPAPRLHVVMDESCIRRPVGGPGTMAAQLEHLVAVAKLPNTLLQVAPYAIGEDRAFDLPVNILTLPDRSLMSYAESSQQGHLERDTNSVEPILTAYYQLQALALPQADAVALLCQLRKELP
ncbi:Scr1 family TA system antitoxin-like transcriptional regulator [Kitasatospora sp. NPDC092948]|uniref:helix-turn-helix domain-containing protein n=1 Tax=Kitasatospora sp. NPDC092948 TaxID=3364088 RepID=UPI0037FC93AC